MKNKIKILSVLVITTLTLVACKKENVPSVKEINCNLDYSTHPKHQKYQDILDQYSKKGIPGMSVVITAANNDYWMGSAGYSSIEDNLKMKNCNLYHTASLAKSFVGVITLQLIKEGKLSFETKIAPFLSDKIKSYTPNVDRLTIKHLLQHTSGIPDIFEVDFLQEMMNNPTKSYTTEELFKFNEKKKALSEPGEKFKYADPNYMLLSLIIDKIEGSHINSIQKRILEPLGLSELHYHDSNYPNINGLVSSYWEQYNDGKVENISDLQANITSYILGSDGIISTPKDMVHFYTNVFEGNLLSNETLDIVKTDWVKNEDTKSMNTGYSHGFMVIEEDGERWIGHTGLQLGASCYVYYNLDTHVTIGVFTNAGTFTSTEKMKLIYYDLWRDLKNVTK